MLSSYKISKPFMSSVPPARNQWHRWQTQRHRSAGDNALLHPSNVIVIVQCTITMCTHPLWLPSAPAHPTIALDPLCAHLVEQWLWNHFCHLGFVRDPLSRLGHRNPGGRCNLPQFGAGQCGPACTWHCCDIFLFYLDEGLLMLGNQTTHHYTQVVFQKVKYLFGYFQKINLTILFQVTWADGNEGYGKHYFEYNH